MWLVLIFCFLATSAIAGPDYLYDDNWDVEVVEASSADNVTFQNIILGASIDGGHDCECHLFDDDDLARFSVNGELTNLLGEDDGEYELSDGSQIEVTDINLAVQNADFIFENIEDDLDIGETGTYTVDGKDYEITLVFLNDSVWNECICDDNSARSDCVLDSVFLTDDPLEDICSGGFGGSCIQQTGDVTISSEVAKKYDSWGYQYQNCGTGSFTRSKSEFNDAYVIDKRWIECGGTGSEDEINYEGSAGKITQSYGVPDQCPADYWCDQDIADNNHIDNGFDDFDITPTDEGGITSDDICRKEPGVACDSDMECHSSLTCDNGVCTSTGGNTTDLEIIDVIPIQVVPGVDMIKDKSGFVRVVVRNNGGVNATGNVTVTFNSEKLTPAADFGGSSKFVAAGSTVNYTFDFKPNITGTNLIIEANVTTS